MGLVKHEKKLSEKEYIQFELQSDIKHEYVNGKLIDMPGESDLHNQLALNCCIILKMLLKDKGYSFFIEGVKVKLPDENKYFYPDVFITKEPLSKGTIYIKEHPELIVEVLSESTRKYDTVDKFINYQRFNSLQYYMLIEPETVFISVFSRIENNDWNLNTYSKATDIIPFPQLGISFTAHEIYSL
jgi:Uma2 family endonuclease